MIIAIIRLLLRPLDNEIIKSWCMYRIGIDIWDCEAYLCDVFVIQSRRLLTTVLAST